MIYKKVYINFPATIQGNKNINLSFLMLRQFTFFFFLSSDHLRFHFNFS